jgi:hypothetical protein
VSANLPPPPSGSYLNAWQTVTYSTFQKAFFVSSGGCNTMSIQRFDFDYTKQ